MVARPRQTRWLRLAAPAPGTPFHRLGAAHRRPWHLPVGFLLVLGGLVTVTVAQVVLLAGGWLALDLVSGGTPSPFVDLAGDVAFEASWLLVLGALVPLSILAVVLVERRPAGTLASVTGKLRWGWLAACSGLALVAVVLGPVLYAVLLAALSLVAPGVLDLTSATGDEAAGEWSGWPTFLSLTAVSLALVPLQATGEEYAFRGWLLQAVGAWTRSPWPAIAVTAVAFSAAHAPASPAAWVAGLITGLVSGWLAVHTGGLEAPVALHVVHNLAASVVIAASPSIDGEEANLGNADWLTAGYTAVQDVMFAGLVLLLMLVWRIARVSPPSSPVSSRHRQPAPR